MTTAETKKNPDHSKTSASLVLAGCAGRWARSDEELVLLAPRSWSRRFSEQRFSSRRPRGVSVTKHIPSSSASQGSTLGRGSIEVGYPNL
eukprot:4018651-Amphidinium_carterae.1